MPVLYGYAEDVCPHKQQREGRLSHTSVCKVCRGDARLGNAPN